MLTAESLEAKIRAAFAGVALSGGVSIRQTEVNSRWGEGCAEEEYAALSASEETTDWSKISEDELARAYPAFFDPPALRFYIPALMISLLRDYQDTTMRVCGTLGCLCVSPHEDFQSKEVLCWALLTSAQKAVIAQFVYCLPSLVSMNAEDRTWVEQAYVEYWSRHAPLGSDA